MYCSKSMFLLLGWDQSDKFMKLYVTLKDVQSVPKENVTCDFTERLVEYPDPCHIQGL